MEKEKVPCKRRRAPTEIKEKLVELVRGYPAIWDQRCNEYSTTKRASKMKIWEKIADELNDLNVLTGSNGKVSASDVQKWWKNLLDNFRKEKREKFAASGSAGNPYRGSWILWDSMQFLTEIVDTPVTEGNITKANEETVEIIINENGVVESEFGYMESLRVTVDDDNDDDKNDSINSPMATQYTDVDSIPIVEETNSASDQNKCIKTPIKKSNTQRAFQLQEERQKLFEANLQEKKAERLDKLRQAKEENDPIMLFCRSLYADISAVKNKKKLKAEIAWTIANFNDDT